MNGLKGEKGDPVDIGGMLSLRVSAAAWKGRQGTEGSCIPLAQGPVLYGNLSRTLMHLLSSSRVLLAPQVPLALPGHLAVWSMTVTM